MSTIAVNSSRFRSNNPWYIFNIFSERIGSRYPHPQDIIWENISRKYWESWLRCTNVLSRIQRQTCITYVLKLLNRYFRGNALFYPQNKSKCAHRCLVMDLHILHTCSMLSSQVVEGWTYVLIFQFFAWQSGSLKTQISQNEIQNKTSLQQKTKQNSP